MKFISTKKLFCLFLSVVVLLTSASLVAYADEKTTADSSTSTTVDAEKEKEQAKQEAQKTLEEQRKDLKQKLDESKKKLDSYEESAKTTEKYINDLDERIGYLNQELDLLTKEVKQAQKKVKELDKQIKPLKTELDGLQKQYDRAKADFDALNDSFTSTYNAYCLRLRAMYISGNDSILAALLTSEDLQQFFSRYEMIKAVSRSDTALLSEVNKKMALLTTKKDGLNTKLTQLNAKKTQLDGKQREYTKQKNTVESKQQEIAEKKVILAEDRAESDRLLAEYTAKTKMYTEYRNEDKKLVEQLDSEIDDLISGLKDPDEVTTADQSKLDNKKPDDNLDNEENALYSRSNGVLNMIYPAPGHYSISAPFGHYSNGNPHTGTDFPCPTGSKIVAAQKGIVISVKRINYSYGYHVMVYHGTDGKGRKVVTLYAHNSSILVSVGQTVKKGEQIAKSGSTGNSTGPHCHFEIRLGGSKINPMRYLNKK